MSDKDTLEKMLKSAVASWEDAKEKLAPEVIAQIERDPAFREGDSSDVTAAKGRLQRVREIEEQIRPTLPPLLGTRG